MRGLLATGFQLVGLVLIGAALYLVWPALALLWAGFVVLAAGVVADPDVRNR